jgi:ribonuclease HI
MYVIGTITRNWKINKNQQYWDIVFRYLSLIDAPITFTHVYGHIGLSENELVDSLAVIMSNI